MSNVHSYLFQLDLHVTTLLISISSEENQGGCPKLNLKLDDSAFYRRGVTLEVGGGRLGVQKCGRWEIGG